jgi:hypothetical protein
MRKSTHTNPILFTLLFAVAGITAAHAAPRPSSDSNSNSITCNSDDTSPVTTHDYASTPGDTLQPHHLELTRPFEPAGKLQVHICHADLRVTTQPDAKQIRLTIHFDTQSSRYNIADYIRTLNIQPANGIIQLKFPKDAHALVTLTMPMGPNSEDEFNLGQGDLTFDAAGGSGSREINVGMGHMQLLLDKDKNYSQMEVNVGMGSLHDHRPGGSDGHFVVSRSFQGNGS